MNTLVLVPTQLEYSKLRLKSTSTEHGFDIGVCGFGPVGAAVGACLLLAEKQPGRVILAGIAGALSQTAEIGGAFAFSAVAMQGIGVTRQGRLLAPLDLGFDELPPSSNAMSRLEDGSLGLQTSGSVSSLPQLLTVCTSAETFETAGQRRRLFPAAEAEDMEGYAVALACAAQRVPLMIIRGISNRAGEQDRAHWQIEGSLEQTRAAILQAATADDWGIG